MTSIQSAHRRKFLATTTAVAATAITGFPAIVRAQARTLIVAGPSAQAKVLEGEVFPIISKAIGAKILFEGGTAVRNVQLLIAQRSAPTISVAMLVDSEQLNAHSRGLLEAPNLKAMKHVGNLHDSAIMQGGAWIRHKIARFAIGTNPTVKPPLQTWAELWEPRYKGKVLVPGFALTQGPYMLAMASHLATGKPLAQAQYDPEPGFAKLKALRANILNVYSNSTQAMALIESGEALAAVGLFSGTVFPRQASGAPIDLPSPREGSFGSPDSCSKVKGGPAGELADAFIDEMVSPAVQAIFMQRFRETPTNKTVALLPGVESANRLMTLDFGWVATNRARLADAYAAALA